MKNPMMAQMMGMMASVLPKPEEPNNKVSEFLRDTIGKLYPDRPEVIGMIEGTIISISNADPDATLRVLVNLHNAIGEFVRGLQENGAD